MKNQYITYSLALCLGLFACGPAPNASNQTETASNTSQDLASGLHEEAELKQTLIELLRQLEPNIQESPEVTEIVVKHAQQIAQDISDTRFKITNYEPIAPLSLDILLQNANVFPADNLITAYMTDGSQDNVIQRFVDQLKDINTTIPYTHFGLGVVRKGQSRFVSLVMYSEIVSLKNAPVQMAATGTRQIEGRVELEGYDSPRFLMTRPDGLVLEIPTQTSSRDFRAEIAFDMPGLYSLEVDVNGPLGPLPASNYIVAVATDYPEPAEIEARTEKISDINLARQNLLALVNQDRQRIGLKSLSLDEKLSEAAQLHSQDMLQNHFIGHNSPTHGTPQMQAARSGVSDLVAQNISLSHSLARSQAELMSSPGHRKTILEPQHTHAGFGIETGPDGFLYVTQLFVQRVIDVETLPTQIKAMQKFNVSGKSLEPGFVAVFVGEQIQGEPFEVTKGGAFSLPVQLTQTGKQRLRIGHAPAPQGGSYSFIFYNIWDIEVQ